MQVVALVLLVMTQLPASGFTTRTVSFDVAYDEFEGGCPSYDRGSMEVEIQLDPR
ncbi:MAG: hypothetical protein GF346_08425 [Candidatus Eisenbacteria bacterium]|nr:hypothetical protein [Candidatus Latescibacterota bacterium]MBD3302459.1 hypothetical protein [Candidatus Eisenbacteria bacterium]